MKEARLLMAYRTVLLALALFSGEALQSQPIPDLAFLTNGLTAYYPFNGNAADASGNGHDGIVHGATLSTDALGRPGRAYAFDGLHNYIEIPSLTSDGFSNDFTISLWASFVDFSNPYPTLVNGDGNFLTFQGNGAVYGPRMKRVAFYLAGQDGTSVGFVESPAALSPQVFHHGVVVRTNNRVRLYLDGRFVSESETIGQPIAAGQYVLLGKAAGHEDTETSFHGTISCLRIYKRALSDAEVKALHSYEGPPSLSIAVKSVRVTMSVNLGLTYQLESSTDLAIWTSVGAPFVASAWEIAEDFDLAATGQYFRLHVVP